MSRRPFIGSFFDGGFVDEHHGNIVADWVNALALDAFQGAPVRLELDCSFASRTREYFQEFLIYCHGMTFLCGTQLREWRKLTIIIRVTQIRENTD